MSETMVAPGIVCPVATATSPELAAARAPRYTSYPTAVQFGPEVNADVYGAWLGDLPAGRPVSIYVHVPFCRRLCWYCGCAARVVNGRQPIVDYVSTLAEEIALVSRRIHRRAHINAIHLGGGSPNTLTADDLNTLFETIGGHFDLAPGVEVAAEIDPGNLDLAWLDGAVRHGLNRASLGVQEFSPRVQAAINRIQPFAVVERAVNALRSRGVGSINLDLIYGLPRQTRADVEATVDKALTLSPERFAVFGYAHVPWMRPHQRMIHSRQLPGAAERLEQFAAAAERLTAAGYVAIGIDHFAKPGDSLAIAQAAGRLHRNFQGYTTDDAPTLLGFGSSAISRTSKGYAQNASDVVAWRRAVREGRLATVRGTQLTWSDRLRGDVIERLMCDFAVDLDAICRRHGGAPAVFDEDLRTLQPYLDRGLAQLDGDVLTVTKLGRPFVRLIATAFDRYFEAGRERHSSAA